MERRALDGIRCKKQDDKIESATWTVQVVTTPSTVRDEGLFQDRVP